MVFNYLVTVRRRWYIPIYIALVRRRFFDLARGGLAPAILRIFYWQQRSDDSDCRPAVVTPAARGVYPPWVVEANPPPPPRRPEPLLPRWSTGDHGMVYALCLSLVSSWVCLGVKKMIKAPIILRVQKIEEGEVEKLTQNIPVTTVLEHKPCSGWRGSTIQARPCLKFPTPVRMLDSSSLSFSPLPSLSYNC